MIILALLIIFAFLFGVMIYLGPYALIANTMSIIYIIGAMFVFAMIGWFILGLLTPKPANIPREAKKEMAESARVSANPFIKGHKLRIRGDEDYQGHVLGTIIGSTRVKYIVTDDENWITNHTTTQVRNEMRIEGGHLIEIEETVFYVKEDGLSRSLSPALDVRGIGAAWRLELRKNNGKEVIVRVPQDGEAHPELEVKERQPNMKQHSPLAGDVFLKCNALNMIEGIFYPNTLAGSTIPEQTKLASVDRKYGMIVLKVMGEINDNAMNANSTYKMIMDSKGLLDSGAAPSPQQPVVR